MRQWKKVTEAEFKDILDAFYRNEAFVPEVMIAVKGLDLPVSIGASQEMLRFLTYVAKTGSWADCVTLLNKYIMSTNNENIIYEFLEHVVTRQVPCSFGLFDGGLAYVKEDAMDCLKGMNTDRANEILQKITGTMD